MLQYVEGNPRSSLCLLVNHDDAEREFNYTAGAEDAVKMATERGWVVVSMKQDWRTVFSIQAA
ncbi:MAG: hypothetical protein R2844_13805 [Caldilineales bacterium]